jgi:beta-xylosidase
VFLSSPVFVFLEKQHQTSKLKNPLYPGVQARASTVDVWCVSDKLFGGDILYEKGKYYNYMQSVKIYKSLRDSYKNCIYLYKHCPAIIYAQPLAH